MVTEDPYTFKSYTDLLDKGVPVAFLNTSDAYLWFKLAREGTLQNKLWHMSRRELGDKTILFQPDPIALIPIWQLMYHAKLAWVVPSTSMKMMAKEICNCMCDQRAIDFLIPALNLSALKVNSIFPFIAEDTSARSFGMQMVFNSVDSPLMKVLRDSLRAMIEMHWAYQMIYAVENLQLGLKVVGGKGASKWSETYHKCVDNTIIKPAVHLEAIPLHSMESLVRLVMHLYFLFILALLLEILHHNRHHQVTPELASRHQSSESRRTFPASRPVSSPEPLTLESDQTVVLFHRREPPSNQLAQG